jgi:hypothetical protein
MFASKAAATGANAALVDDFIKLCWFIIMFFISLKSRRKFTALFFINERFFFN